MPATPPLRQRRTGGENKAAPGSISKRSGNCQNLKPAKPHRGNTFSSNGGGHSGVGRGPCGRKRHHPVPCNPWLLHGGPCLPCSSEGRPSLHQCCHHLLLPLLLIAGHVSAWGLKWTIQHTPEPHPTPPLSTPAQASTHLSSAPHSSPVIQFNGRPLVEASFNTLNYLPVVPHMCCCNCT